MEPCFDPCIEKLCAAKPQLGTGGHCGRLARVFRERLPAAIRDSVHDAGPGDTVGPVAYRNSWLLIHVDAIEVATPDEATQQAVRDDLFQTWLQNSVSPISRTMVLPDAVSPIVEPDPNAAIESH